MIRVGVTGGIGSGKSRVCEQFAALGVSVYNTDKRARELMNGGGEIMTAITRLFGAEAYDGNVADRAYIAGKVFSDKALLTSLNKIMHPAVALDFEAWTMSQSDVPYVVMESAILFESGFDKFVDKVVTVSSREEIRISRVVSRDGVSRQSVMDRMANQLTDEEREARADYIIDNNCTLEDVTVRVGELDKIFRS